jgi:hypothetical protein
MQPQVLTWQAPLMHWLPCEHGMPAGSSQAPTPLQSPPRHSLSGSAFAGTTAHVPFAPPVLAAEQAMHVPAHEVLQHTPSTQYPLEHSPFSVHAEPFESFVHAPDPLQVVTPAHSLSGSVEAVTLPHAPLVPPLLAAEQAWQVPLHEVLQQNPSTQ